MPQTSAAYAELTYRYQHHVFEVDPDNYPRWWQPQEVWTYHGQPVKPHPSWRADGDDLPVVPDGVAREQRAMWNRSAIAETLRQLIAVHLNRDAGSVIIGKDEEGNITFDGIGMLGREVNLDEAVTLTIRAMEQDIADILLPVTEIQPTIAVLDPALQDAGITEVIAVGESNFEGSPNNRRHNIATGLARFNGQIIPKGGTFSFNEILGDVNAATGYKPELVIQGDKTLPEYGGGLCQVSTTAYRGVWQYGFPISQRRNHSFAVQYYGPQGTDATIYPPHTDMKFVNDGLSDVLIQTHVDGDNAYFIYYGLADDRHSEIIGPYTWGHKPAPPNRTEYTSDLAPGEKKKYGSPVPGLKAAWFRVVQKPEEEEETIEGYYSTYQARPLYYQIGIASGQGSQISPEPPSWLTTPTEEPAATIRPVPQAEPKTYQRPSLRSIRSGAWRN